MILFFFISAIFSIGNIPLNSSYPYYLVPTTVLFEGGMYNSNYYRIPSILYLKDESVLAVCDMRYIYNTDLPNKIAVVARRFSPETRSWSEAYLISGPVRDVGDGDPALVYYRKNQTVFALWTGDKGFFGSGIASPEDPQHIYFSRSYDNGITWEDKHDITHFLFSHLCEDCDEKRREWRCAFVSSGAGLQTREGRLTFALLTKDETNSARNYLIYSDDYGETWNAYTSYPVTNADEAKLVELNNKSLLLSIRQRGQRKFAITNTLGASWDWAGPMPDVVDSNCNGEIKRYTSVIDGYERNRLIHSLTYNAGGRKNVSLMVSYDEGNTWPFKRVLEPLSSAYSTFDFDKDGNILVYFEKEGPQGFNLVFANLTLEWLTHGNDTYVKPNHLNWCLYEGNETSEICPANSYAMSFKAFDQYVESYVLYPRHITYTFTENFRDFEIELNREGLAIGEYNVLDNVDPIHLTFKGTYHTETGEEQHRDFTFHRIHATFIGEACRNKNIVITQGTLALKELNKVRFTFGSNTIEFLDDENQVIPSLTTTITADPNVPISLEFHGQLFIKQELDAAKALTKKTKEGTPIIIKPTTDDSSVIVEESWTPEQAGQIEFDGSETSDNKVQIIVNDENKDAFISPDESEKVEISVSSEPTTPPIYEPTYTVVPTFVPTYVPTYTVVPTYEPTYVPTYTVVPTYEPTYVPTFVPTYVPTSTSDPSENQVGKSGKFSLTILIAVAVACLVLGSILSGLIVYCAMKSKISGGVIKKEDQSLNTLDYPLIQ